MDTDVKAAGNAVSLFEAKKGRSQSMSAFPPRETSAEEFKSKLEKAQVCVNKLHTVIRISD